MQHFESPNPITMGKQYLSPSPTDFKFCICLEDSVCTQYKSVCNVERLVVSIRQHHALENSDYWRRWLHVWLLVKSACSLMTDFSVEEVPSLQTSSPANRLKGRTSVLRFERKNKPKPCRNWTSMCSNKTSRTKKPLSKACHATTVRNLPPTYS